jgi:hypothetical protein
VVLPLLESEDLYCTNSKNRDNEEAPTASHIFIMQEPTTDDDDEASISIENVREDPTLSDTFAVRRKAAKRTLPWDLAVDELELVSLQQAEEIRAMKRPRLEEPSSVSTDEAATTISSRNTAISLPAAVDDAPADADHADENADADATPVKVTRTTGQWTPEEDANLNSAVTNNRTKKSGKEYRTDWASVVALFPYRTKNQCRGRWPFVLDPSINQSNKRRGIWSKDEDFKLKDAVQTHDGKNWRAIAALVPGRTKRQCNKRWHSVLKPNIDCASGRTGI